MTREVGQRVVAPDSARPKFLAHRQSLDAVVASSLAANFDQRVSLESSEM